MSVQTIRSMMSILKPRPILHFILLLAIASYLLFRLTGIGWSNILDTLPASPLFYAMALAIFMVLPLTETVAYRRLLGGPVPGGLRTFARKRALNEGVLGYSGEAYLYARLAAAPDVEKKRALTVIKDNNLVSAIVSNTATLILVAGLFLVGRTEILEAIYATAPVAVAGFGALCLVIYTGVIVFFRKITSLGLQNFTWLAGLHGAKVLVVMVLQTMQWASALPNQALSTWWLFLTVQMVLKRLPFLPNPDLVFLSVGISLAGFADGDKGPVIGMLVAAAAMSQLVQFAAFFLTIDRRG